MRLTHIIVGLLVIGFSSLANASSISYLGATYKYLDLDNARELPCDCDMSSSQAGLVIGTYLSENVSLEFDHSTDLGDDDFDVSSLSGLLWSGNNASAYRYYALLGVNHNNMGDGLAQGIDEQSTQIVFGLGVGTKVADNYQVRADMRFMGGHDTNAEEVGFQLSINRLLGSSRTTPQPVNSVPEVVQTPKTKTITINLNVEFEFDKANVLAIYSDQLAAVAQAMQAHSDIELVLEGHTDSVGTESYNNDLSARRAEAVKQKLASDYSISAARISTIGYGESRPIATNATAEGRALNRRVVGEMSFSEIVVD
jgi:OOP family OmpA-OmpF porin